MILNLTYGNYSLLRVVNIDYDDAAHAVTNGSVGTFEIPSGLGVGEEFYRQDGVGEYWSVRVQNTAPYAYVVHVEITLAEDLVISSVDVVKQIGDTLGSITVNAIGTGTLRYALSPLPQQPSNIFAGVYAGSYLVTLSRTEDDYTVSQVVVVAFIPDLEILVTPTNCSAVGIVDGTVRLQILAGSGDYKANFITEGVIIDPATTDVTRIGLSPDSYEVEVTDNESLQVRSIIVVVAYPVEIPSTTPRGTVFEFSTANALQFVIPDSNPQQLDNVLFEDQEHKGYDTACYLQPYNLTDTPTIQFKSNYATHIVSLIRKSDDVVVKQFEADLVEENLDSTVDYSILIKDYGVAGQSKIYFQTGTIPIPLVVGDTVIISNNGDGFDGTYLVIDKLIEVSTGLPIIVINLDYTAGGASSSATGTFDNQLADFNVFQSLLDFSDMVAGIYYITVEASDPFTKTATSEPISLKSSHSGTVAIVYSNTDNDFGIVYSTGYRGMIRVHASIFKRFPGGESSVSRNSNDSLVKVKARKRRFIEFASDLLPPWMVEKLSIIFDNDYFSVNNLAFQTSDELDVNYPVEHARLALTTIKLEQLNWFGTFKSNKDMPTDEACVCDVMDLLAVSASPATINLNMANKTQRAFAITNFGTDKTFALVNGTLALVLKIMFTTTAACVITFPNDFKMSDTNPRWTDADKEFDANIAGDYVGEAVWDGTYFRLTLNN